MQIARGMSAHQATNSAPPGAVAKEMSYGTASKLLGDSPNPAVSPSTGVWLVTVHGPFGFVSAPAGQVLKTPNVYSVVLNAGTGYAIDACSGCAAVASP